MRVKLSRVNRVVWAEVGNLVIEVILDEADDLEASYFHVQPDEDMGEAGVRRRHTLNEEDEVYLIAQD